MSIIYNALQKTQQNRSKENAPHSNRRLPTKNSVWIGISIASIAFFAFMVTLYSHQLKTTSVTSTVEAPKVAAAQQSIFNVDDFKSKHVIGGIYLSNKEKIALINNKFIHPGETIDGMEVVSIESNRVILRNANNALILSAEEAQSF